MKMIKWFIRWVIMKLYNKKNIICVHMYYWQKWSFFYKNITLGVLRIDSRLMTRYKSVT